jgi:hypothetical protein
MKSIIKIISAKCKAAKKEIDNPKNYRIRHVFSDEELEKFKVRSWWYDGRHKRKYQDKSCHDEN